MMDNPRRYEVQLCDCVRLVPTYDKPARDFHRFSSQFLNIFITVLSSASSWRGSTILFAAARNSSSQRNWARRPDSSWRIPGSPTSKRRLPLLLRPRARRGGAGDSAFGGSEDSTEFKGQVEANEADARYFLDWFLLVDLHIVGT